MIHERGYWIGEHSTAKHFDQKFTEGLCRLFGPGALVADLGCGLGRYAQALRAAGCPCIAVDGNPDTQVLTGGVGLIADLTRPLTLSPTPNWVLCLEVGEHIPRDHEPAFVANIETNCRNGLVISWASPGQGGEGHVNERPAEAVARMFAGLSVDHAATQSLRAVATLSYLRSNTLVLRRL